MMHLQTSISVPIIVNMFRVLLLLVLVHYSTSTCPGNNRIIESGVPTKDQNIIVNTHNRFRTLIAKGQVNGQPQGANLYKMKWDKNLQKSAQAIADTCVYGHVKVMDQRFAVGQNIFGMWNTALVKGGNWTAGMEAWFTEHLTYLFGTLRYDHYTQIVWANTYLVGCGYKHFLNNNGWYQKIYVCNYGPAGNFLGMAPYNVGKGCTNLCKPPK